MKTSSEYKAWLATFPPFSEILKYQKKALSIAKKACDKIISFCKSRKTRSSLWLVRLPDTAEPQGFRTVYPAEWGDGSDHIYQHRCEQMRRNVEQELVMEQLLHEGLKILKS